MCLGWQKFRTATSFHAGSTGGFRSSLLVDRAARRAVVVLVADRGRAHIDGAAGRAVSGRHPATARPTPVDQEAVGAAQGLVDDLVHRRFGAAQARFDPQERAAAAAVRTPWNELVTRLGDHVSTSVTSTWRTAAAEHWTSDDLVVQLRCRFLRGEAGLRVHLTPDHRVWCVRMGDAVLHPARPGPSASARTD